MGKALGTSWLGPDMRKGGLPATQVGGSNSTALQACQCVHAVPVDLSEKDSAAAD